MSNNARCVHWCCCLAAALWIGTALVGIALIMTRLDDSRSVQAQVGMWMLTACFLALCGLIVAAACEPERDDDVHLQLA